MGKGKRDQVYSWGEVNIHNDSKSCWLVIRDDVHDVTAFLDEHPGGKEFLLDCTGEDATTEFEEFGHSDEANGMLEQYVIGVIEGSEKAKRAGGLSKASGTAAVAPRKGSDEEPASGGVAATKAAPASSSSTSTLASGGMAGTTRYPRSPSNKMPATERRGEGSSGASAFAPAAALATALVAVGLVRGRSAQGGFFGAIKEVVTANTATKIGTAAAVAFAVISIARG